MKKLYLIKTTSGKEAVISLPTGKSGNITIAGLKMVKDMLDDRLQYALNFEAYTNAKDLQKAIELYQKNTI